MLQKEPCALCTTRPDSTAQLKHPFKLNTCHAVLGFCWLFKRAPPWHMRMLVLLPVPVLRCAVLHWVPCPTRLLLLVLR